MIYYHIVDAFSTEFFRGNPAAVILTEKPLSEAVMQSIAMEFNLSETAFLVPTGPRYSLRWFTPESEVDLCGHATLAAAHILWEEYSETDDALHFDSRSGELRAVRRDDQIVLDFPEEEAIRREAPQELIEVFGPLLWAGMNRFDWMVEMDSEERLRALIPDMATLARLECRGIIVTARSKDYDFVSRFFAPREGISEDPVTGSAHCALGPYWGGKLHRRKLRAYQASRRGGELSIELSGDRVLIGGQATTMAEGRLRI